MKFKQTREFVCEFNEDNTGRHSLQPLTVEHVDKQSAVDTKTWTFLRFFISFWRHDFRIVDSRINHNYYYAEVVLVNSVTVDFYRGY